MGVRENIAAFVSEGSLEELPKVALSCVDLDTYTLGDLLIKLPVSEDFAGTPKGFRPTYFAYGMRFTPRAKRSHRIVPFSEPELEAPVARGSIDTWLSLRACVEFCEEKGVKVPLYTKVREKGSPKALFEPLLEYMGNVSGIAQMFFEMFFDCICCEVENLSQLSGFYLPLPCYNFCDDEHDCSKINFMEGAYSAASEIEGVIEREEIDLSAQDQELISKVGGWDKILLLYADSEHEKLCDLAKLWDQETFFAPLDKYEDFPDRLCPHLAAETFYEMPVLKKQDLDFALEFLELFDQWDGLNPGGSDFHYNEEGAAETFIEDVLKVCRAEVKKGK